MINPRFGLAQTGGNFYSIQINTGGVTGYTGSIAAPVFDMCYDGQRIWRHTGTGTNQGVSYFNTSSPNPITLPLSGDNGYGICSGGGFVWVAGSSSMYKLNTSGIVNVINSLNPIKPCYDGTFIWVTSNSGNTIQQITTSGTNGRTFPITGLGYLYWMCTDGSNLYITSNGAIGRFNIQSHNVTSVTLSSIRANAHVCFDGQYLWVTAPSSNQVIQMRPSDLSVVNTYITGATGHKGSVLMMPTSGSLIVVVSPNSNTAFDVQT